MKMLYIAKENYKLSRWSGGSTSEIFLWPPDGDYAERRFMFRISSAEVEQPESVFTRLPGVIRYISPLQKTMRLTPDFQEPEVVLAPRQVYRFDGGMHVLCRAQGADLNLMLKGCGGLMSYMEPYYLEKPAEGAEPQPWRLTLQPQSNGCFYGFYFLAETYWRAAGGSGVAREGDFMLIKASAGDAPLELEAEAEVLKEQIRAAQVELELAPEAMMAVQVVMPERYEDKETADCGFLEISAAADGD